MIVFRESAAELEEGEKPFCPQVNEKGAHLQWRRLCGAQVGLTPLDYLTEHPRTGLWMKILPICLLFFSKSQEQTVEQELVK